MAINGIGSTTPTFQVDNAAAERRLAEQRQLQQEEQRIREQQTARTEQINTRREETRILDQAQSADLQDFLTRQDLLAQNAQANRPTPGTPAPGSIISVTA
ncbi:MAG TPA: hypothetical protein VGD52_28130 [Pseudoduganella sp.]